MSQQPQASETASAAADTPYQSRSYRNYVLGILTLAYAFNFIDRQLLSILQESIKNELLLSDTQLGLLTGFAFAMFYVTAGIPLARWADRGNRRNIISLAIGVWSMMTALSGLAVNYLQLMSARIGVGVGEAGLSPPAHSIISDVFPAKQRGTAIATYSIGINIGILFGFLLGGVLNEYFGWRIAFMVVGLPGLLLAVWIRFRVAEPIRGWAENLPASREVIPLKMLLPILWRKKSIVYLCLGGAMTSFAGYGSANWGAPFFIRVHGMGTAELGVWLAVSAGVFGGIGTFAAGVLADRWGKADKRWYLWLPALTALLASPALAFTMWTDSTYLALVINFIPGLLLTSFIGPSVAILHSMVEVRMRALASAVLYFVINIIGLGLGPTVIGMISDGLLDRYGDQSLRIALLVTLPTATLLACVCFLMAAKSVRDDIIVAT